MTNYLIVDGVIAAQTPQIEKPFLNILPEFNQIIEIGFHRGALSAWLHKNKKPNTQLVCYDIDMTNKEINDPNITFLQGDCFENSTIENIKSIIQQPGKSLVLCDGGHKNSEFNLYSNFLKTGDVIMCHDYEHSPEDFFRIQQVLVWYHNSESHFASIQNAVNELNLDPYYYDEFKNVLWGSFIKK